MLINRFKSNNDLINMKLSESQKSFDKDEIQIYAMRTQMKTIVFRLFESEVKSIKIYLTKVIVK